MLIDPRPEFRRTAAWLMGRIGQPEFAERLQQAAGDENAGVRETAARSLAVFEKQVGQAISSPAK
jgi:HEAT repeat protein